MTRRRAPFPTATDGGSAGRSYAGQRDYLGSFQRAFAAPLAISLRRVFESAAARALPPFKPPLRPSATAAGSFTSAVDGACRLSAAAAATSVAVWLASLRFLLERLGINSE